MARTRKGREINGILLLDKAKGISSNFALQQVKRLFFAKKAGHTGSLDPLATGILPICLGEATKFASFLLADDKSYQVVAKLGATTTTLDAEGEVTSNTSTDNINLILIKSVSQAFIGNIQQIPPMYSALKKNGVPLYKLARKGEEIKREPRKITIFNIKLLNFKNNLLTLSVQCSKGTYIRTLIDDIGKMLGCGAYVKDLRRDQFAHFNINDTWKFETLELYQDYQEIDKKLIKINDILPSLTTVYLNNTQTIDISFGRKVTLDLNKQIPKMVKILNNNNFLGIGELQNNILQPKKLIKQ